MSGRLRELDGLRGLAAAVVVCEHLGAVLHAPSWMSYTPAGVLMSGFEAVMVFFVLSGYVLALPRVAGESPPHSEFLMRRLLRLWPAYALAVLFAALLRGLGPGNGGILLVASLGMLLSGTDALTTLSSPFWSLIHEARASAIFPLLVRISCSWAGWALVSTLWLLECLVFHKLPGQLDMTLLTLPAFVAGIRLALRPWQPRLSGAIQAVIALACIYVTHAFGDHLAWTIPVDVFAAVLLVTAARRAPAMLLTSVPQYLGRISYSLYLIHFPLFLAVRNDLALLPAAFVLSILLADLSQRYVEAPAIRLGRRRPAVVAVALTTK